MFISSALLIFPALGFLYATLKCIQRKLMKIQGSKNLTMPKETNIVTIITNFKLLFQNLRHSELVFSYFY